MASSAHSIPRPVSTQAPDFSDLTLYRYRVRLSDGDVWAEAVLEPFYGSTWRRQLYRGREGVRKGAMGARQRERADELLARAVHILVSGLTSAGWMHRTDAGGSLVWDKPQEPAPPPAPALDDYERAAIEAIATPPSAYTQNREWELTEPYGPPAPDAEPAQEPAQEPQAAQEPAQAPWEKVLPWQGGGYVSERSRLWTLDVADLATLKLYHHEHTGRYEWLIVFPKSLTVLAASGGPGHKCYSRAERAMLLALHRVLHPPRDLPAFLPPQGVGISHTQREG